MGTGKLIARKVVTTIALIMIVMLLSACALGNISAFAVATPSMEPEYPTNSIVIIHKTPFAELELGDVIVFRSEALGGGLALHRIVRQTEQGFYTKGDGNQYEDAQVITPQTYVGKSVYKITAVAKLCTHMGYVRGLLVFIGLHIAVIMLIVTAIKLIKKQRQHEN